MRQLSHLSKQQRRILVLLDRAEDIANRPAPLPAVIAEDDFQSLLPARWRLTRWTPSLIQRDGPWTRKDAASYSRAARSLEDRELLERFTIDGKRYFRLTPTGRNLAKTFRNC